jgi:hypothetical protein
LGKEEKKDADQPILASCGRVEGVSDIAKNGSIVIGLFKLLCVWAFMLSCCPSRTISGLFFKLTPHHILFDNDL